jgi:hypothetical protein
MTLERAFSPDPLFTWVFPNAATRPAALQRFMRVPLEYGLRYGEVTTSHAARAVGVWLPPGPRVSIPRMIRSGFVVA